MIVLPVFMGEREETDAKDVSGKRLYRNRGEGASGDDADFIIMILPGRGKKLVRFQCGLLNLSATCRVFFL